VARWYCRRGHRTFSLLPDCLAARLSGTLSEVEAVVRAVEQAPSLETACQGLRPDIELPGVLRWARRRVRAVREALHALKGLVPEQFPGAPTLLAFAACLGVSAVLLALRPIGEPFLQPLSSPLGFHPRRMPGDGLGKRPPTRCGAGPAGAWGVASRPQAPWPASRGVPPP